MEPIRNAATPPQAFSRRTFMARGALFAGALWATPLQTFMARRAYGAALTPSPYGPVAPVRDDTTGLPLLQLPPGFRYLSYGWTGQVMSDGVATPGLHDGMAVVDVLGGDNNGNERWRPGGDRSGRGGGVGRSVGSGKLVLVRNHEMAVGAPYTANRRITYRPDGAGGTTNLIFNTNKGRFEDAWSSLAGTIRNCAGSVTPWGSWLTCEETTDPGHGYNFDVGPRLGDPTPLVDMGRFSHEATAVDYFTGWVYETEDSNDCGFYRFVPNVPGQLKEGGELFMLKVQDQRNADLG